MFVRPKDLILSGKWKLTEVEDTAELIDRYKRVLSVNATDSDWDWFEDVDRYYRILPVRLAHRCREELLKVLKCFSVKDGYLILYTDHGNSYDIHTALGFLSAFWLENSTHYEVYTTSDFLNRSAFDNITEPWWNFTVKAIAGRKFKEIEYGVNRHIVSLGDLL